MAASSSRSTPGAARNRSGRPLEDLDEAIAPPEERTRFHNRLLDRLGVTAAPSESCVIDLWRRFPHPDKPLPGGPEVDFVLDGEGCVVFGEAKWRSVEGRGQGRAGGKGQIQLRREFFAKYGRAIYGERAFVVLGIVRSGEIEADPVGDDDGVATRTLTWDRLIEYADLGVEGPPLPAIADAALAPDVRL